MLTLKADTHNGSDPYMVESLVTAATGAMERASIPDITTYSDILSASFTILDRTLRVVRKMQSPEDQSFNTREIAKVLQEFLVDYGSLPN